MRYGITTKATDFHPPDWKTRLIRTLFFFVPDGNPDHEQFYPSIRKWLLEVDDRGIPQREVALGDEDVPLFAAPDDRNHGFWTDNSYAFSANELEPVEPSRFEECWARCTSGWRGRPA
jgi:hypothetical protein